MTDINNTGDQNTILDNDFTVSSESGSGKVLVVEANLNRVGVNYIPTTSSDADLTVDGYTYLDGKVGVKHQPNVASPDFAVDGTVEVQGSKFVIDSSGKVGINVAPSPTSPTYALTVTNSPGYAKGINLQGDADFADSLTVSTDLLFVSSTEAKVGIKHTPVPASSDFTVNGTTEINGNTQINGSADINGNTEINGTTDIVGDTTVDGNIELGSDTSDVITFKGRPQGIGIIPVGAVIPVMDNIAGTYSVPTSGTVQDGWMLCDGSAIPSGQTIPDTESTPKLDDDRFLQGASSAGLTGGNNSLSTGSGDISVQSRTISWQSTNVNTSGETASWNNDSIHLGAFVDRDQLNGGRQNGHDHGGLDHSHGLGGHTHKYAHTHEVIWFTDEGGLSARARTDQRPNDSIIFTGDSDVVGNNNTSGSGDGFNLSRSVSAQGDPANLFYSIYTAGALGGSDVGNEITSGPYDEFGDPGDRTGTDGPGSTNNSKASWNSDIPISGDSFNKSDLNSDQFNHDHHFNKNELNSDQNDHDHDVDINDSRPKFLTCKYLIRVS